MIFFLIRRVKMFDNVSLHFITFYHSNNRFLGFLGNIKMVDMHLQHVFFFATHHDLIKMEKWQITNDIAQISKWIFLNIQPR